MLVNSAMYKLSKIHKRNSTSSTSYIFILFYTCKGFPHSANHYLQAVHSKIASQISFRYRYGFFFSSMSIHYTIITYHMIF